LGIERGAVTPGGSAPLVERVAEAIAWRLFVSTAYTTGLTLLIPFVAVRIQPADLNLVPVEMSPVLLWLAIGLMASALIVRLCVTHSLSRSIKALGLLTFLPGFLGIVAAYVIVDLAVTDPGRYDESRQQVPASLAAYGGRFLVRGGAHEVVEGTRRPRRLVVREFPRLADARRGYDSEEHREPHAIRLGAANANLVFVDGV
jgi:uncharacterized protein (DUF1330 family)